MHWKLEREGCIQKLFIVKTRANSHSPADDILLCYHTHTDRQTHRHCNLDTESAYNLIQKKIERKPKNIARIAKRCPENTSSVIKVSKCSYCKTVQVFFFINRDFLYFHFCHNLGFVKTWLLSQFEFCHNLSFATTWVLSQFKFLSFVAIVVFEFHHNLSF